MILLFIENISLQLILQKKPIYICRASIESVTVTGFVFEKSENVFACIVSQLEQLRLKQDFELLQNKGNGAKVEWRSWDKLNPFSEGFDGAVSTISTGSRVSTLSAYIIVINFNENLFSPSLKFIMSHDIKLIIQRVRMEYH